MVLPRASFLRHGLRVRPQATQLGRQAFNQTSKRGYAMEVTPTKGSDLPWAIGSAVITIPTAIYLLNQGPKGHPKEGGEPGAQQEVPAPPKKGRQQDLEATQEAKGDNDSGTSDEVTKSQGRVASAGGEPSEQKESSSSVSREPTDSRSGAQNPHLADDEKSNKGEGVKDSAKLSGTVDSNRPLAGSGNN